MRGIWMLVGAALVWSTGGLCVKLMAGYHPLTISAGRSIICALFFFALLGGRVFLPREQVKSMLIAAFSYTAVVSFFVIANQHTTAANAITLQYTAPLWIALHLAITKRRPTRAEITALFLGAVGILLCTGGLRFSGAGGWKNFLLGDALSILSGIALAIMTLTFRRQATNAVQRDRAALVSIFWGNIFAAAWGLPVLLREIDVTGVPDAPMWIGWALILWLGLFQLGGGYWLFQRGLRSAPALTASLICLIEPMLNPIWVALGAGEIPGPLSIAGGILIIGAVAMMLLGKHSREEETAHA